MDRSNLRSLPSLASEDAARAESELAALFGGLLAGAERDEESPDYELLEAAVDGTLDPVAAEIFDSRLAGDPALQREVDDLLALRARLARLAQLAPTTRSTRPLWGERVATGRRWLGFAAAAALVAALGLGLRLDLRPTGATGAMGAMGAHPAQAPAAAPGGPTVLFADSFEGGSTEHWSN